MAQLGAYELIGEIGRGSYGVVLRGRDPRTGQQVAIKRLHGRWSEQDLARFRDEGRAGQRVRHPHVAALLETGQDALGPYHVFELVEGRDLQAVLRSEGPLPPRQVAEIGLALGQALAHAHAQGVLHRDLKPSNVLLDAQGRPRLTDFGLARLQGREQSLTATGELVGTPVFMAPEQALADKARIGPASDVYGLGATLYALLTGLPPVQAGSVRDALDGVLHRLPPPPHALRPEVDPTLSRLVMRCLEKAPQARFASMLELCAALRAWLDPAPTAGPRPGRPGGPRLAALILALGGVTTASIVVLRGGAEAPAPAPPPPPPPPVVAAPDPVAREREAAARARALELLAAGELAEALPALYPAREAPDVVAALQARAPEPAAQRLLWLAFVPESGPLEEAALRVSQLVLRPELDVPSYLARLDALAERIGPRVEGSEPERRFSSLVALVHAEGARGAADMDYADPENSCLDRVLETGRGIQITCSLVLIAVARRLGIELQGVCFPGRFLVRHPGPPLLLADPFQGAVFSPGVVRAEARQQGVPWSERRIEPAPRQLILVRLAHFLAGRLAQHGQREASARAMLVVQMLAPRDTERVVARAFGDE